MILYFMCCAAFLFNDSLFLSKKKSKHICLGKGNTCLKLNKIEKKNHRLHLVNVLMMLEK